MGYDEFEATMQDAGWSSIDIEAMWLNHINDEQVDSAESAFLQSLPPIDA